MKVGITTFAQYAACYGAANRLAGAAPWFAKKIRLSVCIGKRPTISRDSQAPTKPTDPRQSRKSPVGFGARRMRN
jgi:hypothetical protein